MSVDARNSLVAWGSVLALFALLWLSLKYAPAHDLPNWAAPVGLGLMLLGWAWDLFRHFRIRRRANRNT